MTTCAESLHRLAMSGCTLVAALALLAPAGARATPAAAAKATGGNLITGTIPPGLKLGPVFSALWLQGKEPKESAGGPFVYLFSSTAKITCADAVKGKFPDHTLLIELVVGATKASSKALRAHSDPPGAGNLYAAWLKTKGGFTKESPATTGDLTVTGFHTTGPSQKSVTGTFSKLSNASKQFNISGSFNATWCPSPKEI